MALVQIVDNVYENCSQSHRNRMLHCSMNASTYSYIRKSNVQSRFHVELKGDGQSDLLYTDLQKKRYV